MLSGLLCAKYRKLLEAKCFRTGAELIRVIPAYASTIGAVKYASRRGRSVRVDAAAGVIAHRGQKLTKRLPRDGKVVGFPVQGSHHALELAARKSRDTRANAWRGVHATYRVVVREQWLVISGGKPCWSATGTRSGGTAELLSRDNRLPCKDNLYVQMS